MPSWGVSESAREIICDCEQDFNGFFVIVDGYLQRPSIKGNRRFMIGEKFASVTGSVREDIKLQLWPCGRKQSFKVRSTAHEGLWPYERMAFYESVANDNLIVENAVTTNREEPSPADQSPVEPTTADLTDFVQPASQHGVSTQQRTTKPPVQNPQTSFIESLDRNVRPRRCKPPVASIRKKMVNQHDTKKVPSLPHNYIGHLFLFLCLLVRKLLC